MGITLTERERGIFEAAKSYALEKIAPHAEEWERVGSIPDEAIADIREHGFFGIDSPEEAEGKGYSYLETALTYEGLAHGDGGTAFLIQLQNNITFEFATFWDTSDEVKALLPDMVSGRCLTAFAFTEDEAGTDPSMGKSYAVLKDDGYHLFGGKTWCSNSLKAKYFNVIVKDGSSPKGMVMLLVDRDTPGFEVLEDRKRIGGNAMSCGRVRFNDCVVPKSMLLSDHGFREALRCIDVARVMVPAIAVGIAQRAIDITLEYLAERETFGAPIIKNQGIQWTLAELQTEVEAARWLVYHAASMADQGEKNSREAAMAKLIAPNTAMKVTTECAQLFGANGCRPESEIARCFSMAKILKVLDGTTEVCKIVIGRGLEKEALTKAGKA